jgi:hypothetical protein
MGHAREAVALLEHVVKVWETTLAETHPSRLASQAGLAMAYREDRQVKKAVELLEHVVGFLRDDHPLRLTFLTALTYLRAELCSESS